MIHKKFLYLFLEEYHVRFLFRKRVTKDEHTCPTLPDQKVHTRGPSAAHAQSNPSSLSTASRKYPSPRYFPRRLSKDYKYTHAHWHGQYIAVMATVSTSSPATLQPCKHYASHGVARRHCCPPALPHRRRRGHGKVTATRATASSRGGQQPSATSGRVEVPVGVAAEDGDSIRRLQNGPDVRGVALEGEKSRPVDLTPLAVELIAESFGEWLHEQELHRRRPEEQLRVSVGRDPRLSGARLSAALFAGLATAGCAVFDVGLATTPACFMSTVLPRFNYDASIMVMLFCLPASGKKCVCIYYIYII